RALFVHHDRESIHPEQMQSEIAQQLIPRRVRACFDAPQEIHAGRGLVIEIALDDRGELLKGLELRKIDLRKEVRWKNEPSVLIDSEWLHVGFHDVWCCATVSL